MSLGLIKNLSLYYIPNTLLKEDIRKLVIKPFKIMAIFKKRIEEEKYKDIVYINEKLDINKISKDMEVFNKINKKTIAKYKNYCYNKEE